MIALGPPANWSKAVAAIRLVVSGAGNNTPRDASRALVSTPSTEPAITAAAQGITRRGTAAASSINAISATMNQLSASAKPHRNATSRPYGLATRRAIADQMRDLRSGSAKEIRQRENQQ
jgi:hypothetical protein